MKNKFERLFNSTDVDARFPDFLLLGGGTDVNPAFYGEAPHPYTQSPDSQRDNGNIEEINKALADRVPIIGICRGLQLLNVYHGGSLIQHLPTHSHYPEVKIFHNWESHAFFARTSHHQGCKSIGYRGEVIGKSDDGIIQAVWWPRFKHLGVQWHPEYMAKDCPANQWLKSFIEQNLEG